MCVAIATLALACGSKEGAGSGGGGKKTHKDLQTAYDSINSMENMSVPREKKRAQFIEKLGEPDAKEGEDYIWYGATEDKKCYRLKFGPTGGELGNHDDKSKCGL